MDAICLTCGVRDNHTNKDGCCQNGGHDAWFEERDLYDKELLKRGMDATGLSQKVLTDLFMNPQVKKIKIAHPIKNS